MHELFAVMTKITTGISSIKRLTSNVSGHQITPYTVKFFPNNLISKLFDEKISACMDNF